MNGSTCTSIDSASPRVFELCFQPLAPTRRGYAFMCDAAGNVDLDGLGRHAFANYLLARALVGRDYAYPVVVERTRDLVPA